MDSMWFLILAHFLGDYAFQTDRMAQNKGKDLRFLTAHVLIYVITIGVLYYGGSLLAGKTIGSLPMLVVACAGIFILHSIQDLVKARRYACSRQVYYLDQALHVIQLFALRLWLG